MAMTILAGSQSRINAILMAVSVNQMVFSWCYNIPLKQLRQELMAGIKLMVSTILMGFNGKLITI